MEEPIQDSTRKYSRSKSTIFSMPRFGTSVVLGIESFAMFTLYVSGYGLSSWATSVAIAAGYLTIAASQFLLGWFSDHIFTRLGRRKPFIFIVAPLLGISFVFLELPGLVLPDLNNKDMLFIWMLIWEMLFRAAYGVTVPYQAWMAEQFEAKDRPKVSQMQNTFNYIGNGLMSVLSLVVFTAAADKIEANINIIPSELLWITVVFAIVVVMLFYITAIVLPTEPKREIKSDLVQNLKIAIRNRNFLKVVLMQGISGFGWSIITTVMLTYTKEVLKLGTLEYLIVAVCLLLGIFVFLYMWRVQIERKGKKSTLLKIFIIAALFLPITFLGLIPMPSMLPIGIAFILGIALVLGGWYLLPYIIYADIADDDDKGSGELRAGVYAGFPSIILNLFQAVGVLLLGLITSIPAIGGASYSFGYILWGPIVSGILFLSWYYTKRYVTLDFAWESKK